MPHRAVIKKDRTTTKKMIVFDVPSCVCGHLSLNERLYNGVELNPELLELFLRFRTHKTGLTADIQKAFLQAGK